MSVPVCNMPGVTGGVAAAIEQATLSAPAAMTASAVVRQRVMG
jgi:hypothetical protein